VRIAVALLVLALAGCGGTSDRMATTTEAAPVDLSQAGARTLGAGTARFTYTVSATISGVPMRVQERGSLAFIRSRAHIYKLLASGGIPQEVIVDGPFIYGNGNVQAAMTDPSVKPWTRLDTRRLSDAQRKSQGDELAHVRAPAFLYRGVRSAKQAGAGRFRGVVDPALLEKRVPEAISAAVASDFLAKPFPAEFWVDANGRVRQVRVVYETKAGGHYTITATYSGFGSAVPLGLPSARGTTDISP
jgi:hypothetical protein